MPQQQQRQQLHGSEYAAQVATTRSYTNTNAPDIEHQLDAEAVAAEVTYTITNTQPSCSGGGEGGCIPNTFKEATGFPQAARWKAASDEEIASLQITMSSDWYRIPQSPRDTKLKASRGCSKHLRGSTRCARNCADPWRRYPQSRAATVPEPTRGEAAERGGQAVLPGDHWSCDVVRTSHQQRHPLRGQLACEDHVQARESAHRGDQASASILGRVHILLNHLQARRLPACCLLGC